MNRKEVVVLILLVIAIATRFIFIQFGQSAIPGFTAIGAMMILGATYFQGWKKWIVPIALFWISDLIVNNVVYAEYYETAQIFGSPWVYLSYILILGLAYIMMKKVSVLRLLFTCTTAAVVFYLVTNFGSWIHPTAPYTKDFSGLMQSYQAGIPFFRNGLVGDVLFGFVFFGLYELFTQIRQEASAPLSNQVG